MCPECSIPVSLLLEVVQLEKTDFEELDRDADLESLPDEQGNLDSDDEDSKDTRKNWKLAQEAAKLRQTSLNETLRLRPDLSTKIHALTADLVQFSMCNPASKLYNPAAPKLDHLALTPEQLELEKRAAAAGIQLSNQPVAAASQMQGQGSNDAIRQDASDLAKLGSATGEEKPGDAAAAEAPPIETVRLIEWKPTVEMDGSIKPYQPIKSVVFSQWTRMINRVEKCLRRTGIQTVRLDGTMAREDRLASLNAFKNDPSVEVFLVSLKAGGFGLNLVSAARAYLIDPYWNPAVENQGLDRVHRLGQTRPVITTKLIMSHSIEENLLELQARKMALADAVGQRRNVSAEQRRKQRTQDLVTLFRTRPN